VQTLADCGYHPNIVRFCGVCLNPLRIVTEYYGKGSLAAIVSKAEHKVGRGGRGEKGGGHVLKLGEGVRMAGGVQVQGAGVLCRRSAQRHARQACGDQGWEPSAAGA
jgi:hypothetical protein